MLKPLLAAAFDKTQPLKFPLIASPKLDGIRCLVINSMPKTRSLKPIPNSHISATLTRPEFDGFDGELMVGDGASFQDVTSGIMTRGGKPDFAFHVFDTFTDPALPYEQRVNQYILRIAHLAKRYPFLKAVETQFIRDCIELDDFLDACLARGYEGAMLRAPQGIYKFGRATFKEGHLIKLKPFEDDEAEVIGFEEQCRNDNEATTNELGRTRRSSHKENLTPRDTLGALILRHAKFGDFNLGTGFDAALRKEIWDNRKNYLGKLAKFRYQAIGMKDKPRIPSFLGFRHPADL
jgi:DNA ligase-1